MTRTDDLIELLNREKVMLTRDFHPRVRPCGQRWWCCRIVPGVLATPAAAQDLDIDYVVATLLTDGVVAGLTAAMRHDLADGLPDAMELIVPYAVNRKVGHIPVSLWRTKDRDTWTMGVQKATIACGAKFHITSPARTVVDLYRTRNSGYRQHARTALQTFVRRSQDQEDLVRLAVHFGVWPRLQPHLEIISELGGMKP